MQLQRFGLVLATAWLCIIPVFAQNADQDAPNLAQHDLVLQGSGQKCRGRLRIGHGTLSWANKYASCNSPYKMPPHEDVAWVDWVVKVEPTKDCRLTSVEIERKDPGPPQSTWAVTGYEGKDAVLYCVMTTPRLKSK